MYGFFALYLVHGLAAACAAPPSSNADFHDRLAGTLSEKSRACLWSRQGTPGVSADWMPAMRHPDSIMQICALVMIQGARPRSVSRALHRTSSIFPIPFDRLRRTMLVISRPAVTSPDIFPEESWE